MLPVKQTNTGTTNIRCVCHAVTPLMDLEINARLVAMISQTRFIVAFRAPIQSSQNLWLLQQLMVIPHPQPLVPPVNATKKTTILTLLQMMNLDAPNVQQT
jgi:hypothetical protein